MYNLRYKCMTDSTPLQEAQLVVRCLTWVEAQSKELSAAWLGRFLTSKPRFFKPKFSNNSGRSFKPKFSQNSEPKSSKNP